MIHPFLPSAPPTPRHTLTHSMAEEIVDEWLTLELDEAGTAHVDYRGTRRNYHCGFKGNSSGGDDLCGIVAEDIAGGKLEGAAASLPDAG